MINFIRDKVSQDKKRFIDSNFNLDLTYITPWIVAMSFPASGFEKTYRNDIEEVARFMNYRHEQKYMVFNLSSREYDYKKLGEKKVIDYPWNDHQAPSMFILFQAVKVFISNST